MGIDSVEIPENIGHLSDALFDGCSGLTSVYLPPSVETMGIFVFRNCSALTSVIIPSNVRSIDNQAFAGCSQLVSAYFSGDAPNMYDDTFSGADPQFKIYHLSGYPQYTSPTWHGYTTVEIDQSEYLAPAWLLDAGYVYDIGLSTDANGDGVSLLMAYALNLDPRQNLASSIPRTNLGSTTMSLDYYASSPGITYKVEFSKNLTDWNDTGIIVSDPDSSGVSTATINRDDVCGFLRLVVTEQ